MRIFAPWFLTLLLAASLIGCSWERPSAGPRTVTFSEAGVSLALGEEWQSDALDSARTARPPTMVSESGILRVILLPRDSSEPRLVAERLHALFEADHQAAKHSFLREDFIGAHGLRIIRVSYSEQSERDGRAVEWENRHYLVKNSAGRCVAINYLAKEGIAPGSVNRMITGTLALR